MVFLLFPGVVFSDWIYLTISLKHTTGMTHLRSIKLSLFLIIKPTRCTNSLNLCRNKTAHVSDSSYAHHQEFFTVHTAMVYVIQVCWLLAYWSCSQAVSKPVCHIPLLCVQWKTPDDGQRNCPKHVEFYSKNKFEKISASSWFYYKNLSQCTVTWTSNLALFTRLYKDARSTRHKITTVFIH